MGRDAILGLMKAIDEYILQPAADLEKPFLMPIEGVATIPGRGTVVTGRVERGVARLGDKVDIVGFGEVRPSVVTGLEMFRKELDLAQAGDQAGVLLRGIDRDRVARGR